MILPIRPVALHIAEPGPQEVHADRIDAVSCKGIEILDQLSCLRVGDQRIGTPQALDKDLPPIQIGLLTSNGEDVITRPSRLAQTK